MRRPPVQILYFDGCPNYEGARALVVSTAEELGLQPEVELVRVADPDAANRLRFLGSPTIRISGRDVEPGADTREEWALSCRVYQTEHGLSALPDPSWIRTALRRAAEPERHGLRQDEIRESP